MCEAWRTSAHWSPQLRQHHGNWINAQQMHLLQRKQTFSSSMSHAAMNLRRDFVNIHIGSERSNRLRNLHFSNRANTWLILKPPCCMSRASRTWWRWIIWSAPVARTSKTFEAQQQTFFTQIFHIWSEFRLSYYPHRLEVFKTNLKEIFGHASNFEIYGDFKPLDDVANPNPAFYIHVVEKHK